MKGMKVLMRIMMLITIFVIVPSLSFGQRLPDLIVSDISLINDGKIQVTIKNVGRGGLPDSAYHKTNGAGIQMYNGNKPWGGISLFAVDPTMKLKMPGGSVSWVWFPKAVNLNLTPGVHSIRVVVDSNNAIRESKETNNLRTKTFTIYGIVKEANPDLAISSMTFSPISQPEVPAGQRHPTVGDWVTFSTVIKNLGLSPSNAAYLKLSLTTPKGRVRYLGRKEISPLQQNANTTIERKFKAKFRGRYVVGASIVPKNLGTFSDSDSSNNNKTMSIPIYFPADLYLCMRREENVLTRHRSGIEVTVKNAGPGPSEAAKLTIHIDGKGDKTYPIKPLMAKESVTITRYVKFYRGGRTHRYRAKIDLLGSPWDAHYNNNYLTGVIKTHGNYVLEPLNYMHCSR